MMSRQRVPSSHRFMAWVVYVLATVLGLRYGYDFGHRIGGLWLGVFLALIGAAFTSILADAALDRVLRWRASRAGKDR